MKSIWKFELDGTGYIEMPAGARIIHVGLDPNGVASVWAEVMTENKPEETRLQIVGTGGRPPDDMAHVGSFVDKPFVWHVYHEQLSETQKDDPA